nr:MAG TPA: hypothetical protein [Caudoviricetes sp.]
MFPVSKKSRFFCFLADNTFSVSFTRVVFCPPTSSSIFFTFAY